MKNQNRQSGKGTVALSNRKLVNNHSAIFDNVAIGMHWVNAEGIIIWANQTEMNLLGYSPDEYIGHNISEFHADKNVIDDILVRLSRNETLNLYEARLRCKDGSVRNVIINSNVLWEDDKFIHTRCFTLDVTEPKQAQNKLIESENRHKQFINGLPAAFYTCNAAGFIEVYNDAAVELWGRVPEVGKDMWCGSWKIFKTDGSPLPLDECPMAIALKEGRSVSFEIVIERPDGSRRSIIPHPQLTYDTDGNVTGAINTLIDISPQVEARKKVEDSETRYNLMLMQSQFAFLILKGKDMVVHLANASMKEVLGKGNNIEGKPLIEVLPEIKDQAFPVLLDNVYNTGIPFTANEMLAKLTRNGILEDVYFNYVYQPYHEADGTIAGVTVIAYDVTSAVISKKKIEENEKQFNTLANSIQNLAWMANAEGWIYWYNARWYEYTGTKPEEMEGWGWKSVHDPEQLPEVLAKWQRSINTGEPFEMVFPLKGADNIFRPFLTLVLPLRDDEGKITRWIGTNTDISVQKEAEQQFRQMAERMPQKVWTADGLGNRNYFNQGMLDYSGFTFDELKDWGWKQIVHPEDWPKTKQKWEHSINTGDDLVAEYRLLRKDGKYLWHLVRATAIKDEKGRPKMWIGSKTEIHEQIELSETLSENLKRSNERMQTILQHAPDAVISIDEDGIIKSWNYEAELIFGWKEHEVIEKMLTETIIPNRYHEGHDKWMKHFLRIGEGPVINKPIELSAVNKNGIEFPVELKISTSKINDGYIFIGFIRDISIRKEAEQTIQNKTNQLMEAQQLAHIGSWEWDVVANKIEWSDELFRIFGLNPQEFKAGYENYLKYIHPDDREYVNSIIEIALKDHKPYSLFHKVACADGKVRILKATGKVITDGIGNVIRMSGTAQDVTEQKNYEAELKISEERFYKIFDSNPIPMTLSEIKTNKIQYANTLFYNAFGYTKEEVIGNSSEEMNLMDTEEYKRVIDLIFEYLHENRSLAEVQALSKEETETLLLRLKQSEKMKDFEICYTRKNGEKFPALVSFEIIRIGTESYTVTSYQDITERKKAEALLRSKNDQLEKMNKELEAFAYISSHDLQEPLRKIQTFSTRISEMEENNLSENGKDMFNRMQNAAKRMQILIQDLLAYSRTTTTERQFETTDLNKIIAEVSDDLKEELNEKHATIEANHLCDAEIIPFQFRQLMLNLISNSLKFSKPNAAPHIQIKSEIANGSALHNQKLSPQNTYCHITVSDNGIGFEQQYSKKIFEVFQRLNGKEEYNGTGIGLSIVKKIVENHNGIITATGELNKGATFDIYIPTT